MMGMGLGPEVFAWALAWLAASEVETAPPDPQPIVLGQDASECQFAATAALIDTFGSPFCSASLIHPQVMLLAAHCIDPITGYTPDHFAFGEDAWNPVATAAIDECVMHPMYGGEESVWAYDLAYCTLAEAPPAVPIVPVLAGCEADQLVPGGTVTIAGFGMNDEGSGGGVGTKRWTTQTIESIGDPVGDLFLLGIEGSSACYGDSGGPVFLQLADGSWRVAGAASTTHPSEFGGEFPTCGTGVVYELVHTELEWLEGATGIDVTVCHDGAEWAPTPACTGFPLAPGENGDAWAELCSTASVSGAGASCGDPFGGSDESSTGEVDESSGDVGSSEDGSSSGAAGTTDDGGTSSDDGASASASATASATATAGESTGDPLAGTSSDDGAQDDDGEPDGCNCSASARPRAWMPAVALLFVLGKPRRRKARPM
jgi:MYXO-CTERM domain-containing protein